MNLRHCVLLAGLTCSCPALAVDFGVMETADPVAEDHFKFNAYPILLQSEQRHYEGNSAVVMGVGYGFAPRWDAELQVATFDDLTLVGLDAEYSFIQEPDLETSLAGGIKYGNSDFGQVSGYDATAIVSVPLAQTRATLTAALDYSHQDLDADRARAGLAERYDAVHLVPGAELRISRDLDFIGELGIGLNDDARDYLAAGLSYYFR